MDAGPGAGKVLTEEQLDWASAFLGQDVRSGLPADAPDAPTEGFAPGGEADQASSGAPGGPPEAKLPVAPAKPDEMDEEDLVAAILQNQKAILTGWDGALEIFQTFMTSASHMEASPNFQNVLVNFVPKELIGKVVAKATTQLPIMAQVVGLITALQDEASRAGAAGASAKLRDFYVAQKKYVTSLQQSLESQGQALISSVKNARKATEDSLKVLPKPKGKGGGTQAPTDAQNQFYGMLRMELLDLLAESKKVLASSNTNALFKVISGEWLNQSQATISGLGDKDPAWIHIRLDKNYATLDATFRGPGGQKIAEQMLKDAPGGVDVWNIKTKRVVAFLSRDYPVQVTVDANNRDITPPAVRNKASEEQFKWLMANGVKPTKNVSGD